MKKYLISYGDSNYAIQKEFLRETATASSFFDEIIIFNPEDIDHSFEEHIHDITLHGRGGGYWTWKPYFVKRILDQLDENDILTYCDAGSMINGIAKTRFEEYMGLLQSSLTGTLDFELPFKEFQYTKQEVFNYFNTPTSVVNSNQLMATVLILKKCAHTDMIVGHWYNTVLENLFLFTDEKNGTQHLNFIDHRHDQSIFSVIRKTYGANIIPDETYFLDFLREGRGFPFWATRLKR